VSWDAAPTSWIGEGTGKVMAEAGNQMNAAPGQELQGAGP